MNCPTCDRRLDLYSPPYPGREAVFICRGPHEHFWKPSDFASNDRAELERIGVEAVELSKANAKRFAETGSYGLDAGAELPADDGLDPWERP